MRRAPSRATRPRSWLRLVTTTRLPVPGSSGRTWSASRALSSSISVRLPASRLRSRPERSSTVEGHVSGGTPSARRKPASAVSGVTGVPAECPRRSRNSWPPGKRSRTRWDQCTASDVLPTCGGAFDDDDAGRAAGREAVQLGEFGAAAGEAGDVEGQLTRDFGAGGGFGVGGEQLGVQAAQVFARFDAELVGQQRAQSGVARQRLGASPGPGEHAHQPFPQGFPQRVLRDEVGELGDQPRVGDEPAVEVDPLLDGEQVPLGQQRPPFGRQRG